MFPTDDLSTKPLVEGSVMVTRKPNNAYVENPIEISVARLQILDCHGASQVFTIAHF